MSISPQAIKLPPSSIRKGEATGNKNEDAIEAIPAKIIALDLLIICGGTS